MWENETIVLVTSLKKRILGGQKKAAFSRISSDNAIPPFIKALFQAKVENYILTESPFSLKSTPHFDLKSDDLDGMKSRFRDVLREAAVFPATEVDDILREALVLRLDYLIKPSDTMRRLLFDQSNEVTLSKMEMTLDPYTKLLPYAERLLKECRRLGHGAIEMDEYGKLVMDLFQQMLNGESVKVVLHDFSVLTDFLSETKGEEISRVDGDVMQEFLADRNLWNFRRALDIEIKLGKADFDAVDLEMTMKRYLEMRAEFGEEVSIPAKPTQEESHPEEKIESGDKKNVSESWDLDEALADTGAAQFDETQLPDLEVAPSAAPEKATTINGFDEEEIPDPEPITETESFNDAENVAEPDTDVSLEDPILSIEDDTPEESPEKRLNEEKPLQESSELEKDLEAPREEKKQPASQMRIIRRDQNDEEAYEVMPTASPETSEAEQGSNLLGLKNLIDDRTQKVFIKKLFDGDKENYHKLLDKLEEAESWRVAKILIDNELFKRDVDPFSREAIKLVDLVYSRYYPEEGVGGA